jgi:hypothetical protein
MFLHSGTRPCTAEYVFSFAASQYAYGSIYCGGTRGARKRHKRGKAAMRKIQFIVGGLRIDERKEEKSQMAGLFFSLTSLWHCRHPASSST